MQMIFAANFRHPHEQEMDAGAACGQSAQEGRRRGPPCPHFSRPLPGPAFSGPETIYRSLLLVMPL